MRKKITNYRQALNMVEMSFSDLADGAMSMAMETHPCMFNGRKCQVEKEIKDTLSWGKLSMCQQFNPFVPGKCKEEKEIKDTMSWGKLSMCQ